MQHGNRYARASSIRMEGTLANEIKVEGRQILRAVAKIMQFLVIYAVLPLSSLIT
jgi:hypothetical protein